MGPQQFWSTGSAVFILSWSESQHSRSLQSLQLHREVLAGTLVHFKLNISSVLSILRLQVFILVIRGPEALAGLQSASFLSFTLSLSQSASASLFYY
jgi:hypothetical protein